jgi:hypothetical protein
MLWVIGLSTAVEYGLKGLYESTIGRLAEFAAPADATDEERYAARVSREYAELIVQKGWYEFDFGGALAGLWKTVPATGRGMIRKWERRFALSAEYGVKAAYAWLIGLGTGSVYTPDDLQRAILVAGWSDSIAQRVQPRASDLLVTRRLDRGYTLLSVPRYTPYRDALLVLADHARALRIAEISGCDFVTLTGTAPARWRAPAEAGQVRVLLSVRARDVLDVLATLKSEGEFHTDHIYDY